MSWTDERVETLKKMWSDGQSASQIAKELGGVTRNAVIGKVHRLGLSNRAGAAVPGPGGAAAQGAGAAGPEADDDAAVAAQAGGAGNGLPNEGPVLASAGQVHATAAGLKTASTDALDEEQTDDGDADDDTGPAGPSLRAGSGALDPPEPPMSAARRAIIPAGQPLPPQPSLNEISPEALAKVNEVEKTAKRLTLMELTEKTCKWPVGDPATPDFWFCGLPVQQGKPYCEAHVGVAFQPMSARRDRRR